MFKLIILPIVGFLVGILVISLGGGGGMFFVGILTSFFNIPPAIAAATSLATIIPTTATGSYSHWKAGNINFKYGFTMLIGGVSGAILGSLCSSLLPQDLYNKVIGIIMLLLSLQMVILYFKKRNKNRTDIEKSNKETKNSIIVKAIIFGFLGGAMSGLIGLSGGGPIIVGLSVLGCSSLEIVGTSVLVLLGISITGFTMHLGIGNVDWQLVGLLLIGTVSGAFIGPLLLKRIDTVKMEKVLQPILLVMVVVMGILLIFK